MKEIKEDIGGSPTNNVGGGNIAGCNNDPPVDPKNKKRLFIIKKALARKSPVNEGIIGHAIGTALAVGGSVSRALDKNALPPMIPSTSGRWRWFIKPMFGQFGREQQKRQKQTQQKQPQQKHVVNHNHNVNVNHTTSKHTTTQPQAKTHQQVNSQLKSNKKVIKTIQLAKKRKNP